MKQKITAFLLAFLLLLCLAPAALADGAQLSFLTDDAGLLTASESAALEKTAQSIAQRWGVGIYIVTVDDSYRIDGRGTYEAAYTFYHNHSLGVGAERNGAILLLSMNDRAFARFYYGEKSEYAFNGYAQEQIEDVFLDNFRENDWYGGFSDYLTACGEYLALAAEGRTAMFPARSVSRGRLTASPTGRKRAATSSRPSPPAEAAASPSPAAEAPAAAAIFNKFKQKAAAAPRRPSPGSLFSARHS